MCVAACPATGNHWRGDLRCMWLQQTGSSMSEKDDMGMAGRIQSVFLTFCLLGGIAFRLTGFSVSVLLHCWLGHLTFKIVSEMTYTVSSGTLNSTIPYHTIFLHNTISYHLQSFVGSLIRFSKHWSLWCRHRLAAVGIPALLLSHVETVRMVCDLMRITVLTCWLSEQEVSLSPELASQVWQGPSGQSGKVK